MTTHPIIKDLTSRKTAKRYSPGRRVPQEQLKVVYEALRLTASSINSQPWRFIVIESDDAKHRLEKTFARKNFHNKKHVFDASHIILLAHNPRYMRADYERVVDADLANGRGAQGTRDELLSKYAFAETRTDAAGFNGTWTMAQVYIALGNALHALARLNIDGTPMEGLDHELIVQEFEEELDGYVCHVALVLGYHHPDDLNSQLPKSRLPREDVLVIL